MKRIIFVLQTIALLEIPLLGMVETKEELFPGLTTEPAPALAELSSEKIDWQKIFQKIEAEAKRQVPEKIEVEAKRLKTKSRALYPHKRKVSLARIPVSTDTDGKIICKDYFDSLRFSTIEELANHVVSVSRTALCQGKYKCYFCPQELSASGAALRQHIYRHLNIRNHLCTHCGKKFVTASDRNTHQKEVHDDFA